MSGVVDRLIRLKKEVSGMAISKDPTGGSSRRVETALKAVMEAELARQKTAGVSVAPGLMWFSNGVIFSKSGNGTPFSNGIIFSKTGSQIERPEETVIVGEMVAMDDAAFNSFADRLIKMKQTQTVGQLKQR
jgi:hypothetical protein